MKKMKKNEENEEKMKKNEEIIINFNNIDIIESTSPPSNIHYLENNISNFNIVTQTNDLIIKY